MSRKLIGLAAATTLFRCGAAQIVHVDDDLDFLGHLQHDRVYTLEHLRKMRAENEGSIEAANKRKSAAAQELEFANMGLHHATGAENDYKELIREMVKNRCNQLYSTWRNKMTVHRKPWRISRDPAVPVEDPPTEKGGMWW